MTLNIKDLYVTRSVTVSVMVSAIMLNVVMRNGVMLSGVAPLAYLGKW